MTYSEFRYTLKENIIPPDRNLVVNYNTVGGITTIDDVAVRIEGGNLPQLQEATLLSLSIPQLNGVAVNINVESSTSPVRVVDKGIVGDFFCYSIITPSQRPVLTVLPAADPEAYPTDVVIEPVTATGAYNYNTYNPLIGNTITDRESDYIVHSDRGTTRADTKTNPTNIVSILSDQAVHANIQDSLYTDTGWINARYEGTKLSPSNNSGTDPVLQGTFFEAAFFGIDVVDADITAIASADLTFKEYISSGKTTPPKYVVGEVALIYSIEGTVVQIASEGKLRVKATEEILNINSLGYIVAP